jgi:O-acetyl-ADP-ribose deacetylase (regulator of RNase III)
MSLWKEYDVSPEAFLIRTAGVTNQPVSIFAAARSGDEGRSVYRLDYCIPAGSSSIRMPHGLLISDDSVLKECTAIGFTAKGFERWNGTEVFVECVGIPPYPGRTFPRVVGLVREKGKVPVEPLEIEYRKGDVTETRGTDTRVVAHIVNDKASTWGAGAALSIARRWPLAHSDFRNWSIARREDFELGVVHQFEVSDNLWVASMVAQHGYGESLKPRIRYAPLRDCLLQVSSFASEYHASVHMPRIGTGFAGGNWKVIENLIIETLISRGVKVFVYDLPNAKDKSQAYLDSSLTISP